MNRHCTNLCSFLSNLASSDRTFKALSHIATPFSPSRLRSPNRGDSFLFESSSLLLLPTASLHIFAPAPLSRCTGGGSQCLHSEREREKKKEGLAYFRSPRAAERISPPFHLIYLFCVINVPGRSRLRREKKRTISIVQKKVTGVRQKLSEKKIFFALHVGRRLSKKTARQRRNGGGRRRGRVKCIFRTD